MIGAALRCIMRSCNAASHRYSRAVSKLSLVQRSRVVLVHASAASHPASRAHERSQGVAITIMLRPRATKTPSGKHSYFEPQDT